MARIFKPTYTADDGTTKASKAWHVAFKHGKTWRRVTGFTDKDGSETLGRRLDKLVGYRATREPLNDELSKWIDGLDDESAAG
jgi:hypothetical protein